MDISDGRYTTELLQFLDRANSNNFFQIIAHPKRDGGTPVTVTRNVPITSVGDPVGETLLLNKGWHPNPNTLVPLNLSLPPKDHYHHTIASFHCSPKSCQQQVGHEQTKREWHDRSKVYQISSRRDNYASFGIAQSNDHVASCPFEFPYRHPMILCKLDIDTMNPPNNETNLDVLTSEISHGLGKATLFIQRTRKETISINDAMLQAYTVIVFTKGRSVLDNTSTRIVSDISIHHDLVTLALEFLFKVWEHGLEFPTLHVSTLITLENSELGLLGILVESIKTLLQKNVVVASQFILDLDIFEIRMHRNTQTGWQGPRSGGPCKQLSGGIAQERETNNDY